MNMKINLKEEIDYFEQENQYYIRNSHTTVQNSHESNSNKNIRSINNIDKHQKNKINNSLISSNSDIDMQMDVKCSNIFKRLLSGIDKESRESLNSSVQSINIDNQNPIVTPRYIPVHKDKHKDQDQENSLNIKQDIEEV